MKETRSGSGAPRRRLVVAAAVSVSAICTMGIALSPAAHADSASASGTSLTGYTLEVQALAFQYGFNIPGIVPLPNQNLIEADVPFARTSVSNGPVINAQGTPYYPGDILGNFGSLLSEFAAGSPPVPNDPFQADAQYPPTPSHGQDASFGGNPPAGLPIAPDVASGTAHADQNGASVTATVVGLQAGAPAGTSSSVVHMGAPVSSPASGLLGSSAAPPVEIGTIQSTNQVSITGATVSALASTELKAVDIAGVISISQITSNATSQSDGNQGSPTASLHLVDVTVEGQPAYIDNQGVHITGQTVTPGGVTPQQAQSALDSTLSQDGINVRVLDPQTNSNGAEGIADSGGLVVSISHQFAVPFVPGEPTVPFPGLGNVGLPAGVYTATTSITLGAALSDVTAAVSPPFGSEGGLIGGAGGDLGLGVGSLGGSFSSPGSSFSSSGGSTNFSSGGSRPLAERASSRLPLGIPAPLGWVVLALILCVIFTYPMLLTVRWQFLSGRGRRWSG